MDRRAFIGTLTGGLLAGPLAAEAQQAGRIRQIGFLSGLSPEAATGVVEEFRSGLRERGYVEGQNIRVEYRWAEGKADRLPGLVADLIRLGVELIVAAAAPAARAAHQATRTIPIVMVAVGNPVELGLAVSLARPGGNVTGFTSSGPDLTAKQLDLLRDAVPGMKRLAVLWSAGNPLHPGVLRDLEELTRSRGIQVQSLKIASADELEGAFRAAATARGGRMGRRRSHVLCPSRAHRRTGAGCAAADIIFWESIRRGRRSHGLRAGLQSHLPPGGHARGQDLEGHQAGRASHRGAHQVRAGHQPQDRQGPRPHDPPVAPAAGGSGVE